MLRQISQMNAKGNLFILVVVVVISFVYYTGQYLSWWVKTPICAYVWPISICYHILFFLFIWSFLASIFTDPGRVPLYWGFFLDDPEHRKRRYCLICHIFKPERCHHCSACNRCVLNMDHHCPWINNCVGFYNRKFFILMIVYAEISLGLGLIGFIRAFVYSCKDVFSGSKNTQWIVSAAITVGLGINATLFFTLLNFLKFHITMILRNMTTIENLDQKRGAQAMFQTANYDMGKWYNWLQIFGKNSLLWPFPVFMQSGKPVGDGVVWPQKYIEFFYLFFYFLMKS